MAKPFQLSIVTPERILFNGDARYVSVPGSAGYMGILVDHAPIISSLKPGKFEVRMPDQSEPILFSTQKGGFLEVISNRVSILLDAVDSNAFSVPPQ